MTLIVPTAYRRNFFRERNEKLNATASDAAEVALTCLRCFKAATVGTRCDDCRMARVKSNVGRKR
jgi:hypothetical protein